MKVFLIVPKSINPKQTYREYPLGVGYIGTMLQHHGHKVEIYDQTAEGGEEEQLDVQIQKFGPDVIGFSIITPNYPVAQKQIQHIKMKWPHCFIIAGGIHATLFPEDLLADGVDLIVLGEGEQTIVRILDCIIHNKSCESIAGVVFRHNTRVIKTPLAIRDSSLEIPIIDRNLYNLSLYTHHSLLASRGCPFHCQFCCNYTDTLAQTVYVRKCYEIIDEIQLLQNRFNAREIFFVDDIFLLQKSNIKIFCEALLKQKLNIPWVCQMRANTIDDEISSLMAAAKCQRIYFGVESGSDSILKRINKGMDCNTIARGITSAKASKIRVKTGWIYGLPGTLKEQYESIPFMLETRPHEISIHQLIPFPGTPYYEKPEEYGIQIANPKDFKSFCYGGLNDNIKFNYLSYSELITLFDDTARILEANGYVCSDKATSKDEYIYTTPLCATSMKVFHNS